MNDLPLLLDARQLSKLLGRSIPSLERDIPLGRVPAPVTIGRSRKWRRVEIEAWIADGCPTSSPSRQTTPATK